MIFPKKWYFFGEISLLPSQCPTKQLQYGRSGSVGGFDSPLVHCRSVFSCVWACVFWVSPIGLSWISWAFVFRPHSRSVDLSPGSVALWFYFSVLVTAPPASIALLSALLAPLSLGRSFRCIRKRAFWSAPHFCCFSRLRAPAFPFLCIYRMRLSLSWEHFRVHGHLLHAPFALLSARYRSLSCVSIRVFCVARGFPRPIVPKNNFPINLAKAHECGRFCPNTVSFFWRLLAKTFLVLFLDPVRVGRGFDSPLVQCRSVGLSDELCLSMCLLNLACARSSPQFWHFNPEPNFPKKIATILGLSPWAQFSQKIATILGLFTNTNFGNFRFAFPLLWIYRMRLSRSWIHYRAHKYFKLAGRGYECLFGAADFALEKGRSYRLAKLAEWSYTTKPVAYFDMLTLWRCLRCRPHGCSLLRPKNCKPQSITASPQCITTTITICLYTNHFGEQLSVATLSGAALQNSFGETL